MMQKVRCRVNIIIQLGIAGQGEFLKKVFSPLFDKRRNKMRDNATKTLMIVIEVEKLINNGYSVNRAFNEIAKTTLCNSYDEVKNCYYRGRNKEYEFYVDENDQYKLMLTSLAKIGVGSNISAGSWEIKTFSNKPQEVKFAIYNPPLKKIKYK